MLSSLLSSPGSLFAEFDRLQRELQQAFTTPSSIRAVARGTFPAINIGVTPGSVEVYAFVPGVDPSTLDVSVDRGLLTISGRRTEQTAQAQDGGTQAADVNVYVRERFTGSFRRVVSLPEDVDIGRIDAMYRDGVLRVSVARREAAQPKRITVN
ncbi:HSP20 family protein [Cupriavidus gilardii J11]|uniref:HSP20 family protein n=1 Tax=Cupriavidus gilardii J11 TaxID=936133 RepID=A0A562BR15_9BURK|nr:Hsp20/alpha crystallin family protein [Cupriavidus gilardii]TWG87592.1 HSP20 family protein [Cupriavidus gilardii J11]